MSERVRSFPARARAAFLWRGVFASAGVACALAALPLSAQGPAEGWAAEAARRRAAFAEAARAVAVTTDRLQAVTDSLAADRTALLTSSGITIRHQPGLLSSGDSAALVAGLARAVATLEARHGAGGLALIGRPTWEITRSRDDRFRGRSFSLVTDLRPGARRYHVAAAAIERRVESLVLSEAAIALDGTHPALAAYAGGQVTLGPSREAMAFAARALAMSWSGAARRCHGGSLPSCRTVLTPVGPEARLAHFFDPGDHPAVAVASESPAGADSAFHAGRLACREGERSACAAVLPRMRIPDPIPSTVRASLVSHALALGGPEALARLGASRDAALLPALAAAAATSEDSLIASWQRELRAALEAERPGPLPATGLALGWAVLAVAVVARRRP
jgi:hypothetical protein